MFFGKPNINSLKSKRKVNKLIQALAYKNDENIPIEAAAALGELQVAEAIQPLVSILHNGTEDLKLTALKALGEIGLPDAEADIIAVLNSKNPKLILGAIETLWKFGGSKSEEALIKFIEDKPEEMVIAGIDALGRLGKSDALDILFEKLKDESEDVKIAAIKALGLIGDKKALVNLTNIYKDSTGEIRSITGKALSTMGFEPDKFKADDWKSKVEQKAAINIPLALMNKIKDKGDLPSMPDIVHRLNEKLKDPEVTLKDVAVLIKTDAALTARIIQVANSAYYSSGQVTITNLQTAVSRLGIEQLRNIVYSFAVLKQFEGGTLIDKKKFWLHSLIVGFLSQSMLRSAKAKSTVQESAFMAGLMHDIGLMVFVHIIPEEYSKFLKTIVGSHINDPDFRVFDAEYETFKAEHAGMGAAYIEHWWPVSEEIVQSVRDHHLAPTSNDISDVTRAVIIANEFCESEGINNGVNVNTSGKTFRKDYFKLIGLTDEQVDSFYESAKTDIETAKMFVS